VQGEGQQATPGRDGWPARWSVPVREGRSCSAGDGSCAPYLSDESLFIASFIHFSICFLAFETPLSSYIHTQVLFCSFCDALSCPCDTLVISPFTSVGYRAYLPIRSVDHSFTLTASTKQFYFDIGISSQLYLSLG
jgi:hypothetical protein